MDQCTIVALTTMISSYCSSTAWEINSTVLMEEKTERHISKVV